VSTGHQTSEPTIPTRKSTWWVRPAVGAVGLITLSAALGGPGAVLNLSFSSAALVATSISAAIGLALALWILWRPLKIAASFHNGIGLGVTVGSTLVLRQVMSDAPVVGSIIFGVIGGYFVAAAVLPARLRPARW
jgi:hypothetical protein